MESLVLIAGFVIVFGGIGYVVMESIKHFNLKAH